MATKWSAFSAGSAIADANEVVGLQSGGNVRWLWSAVKTYILGAATAVLAIAANKTVTISNSLTLAGTDSTTMTFPATSATIARTDASQTFTGGQIFSNVITAAAATATPAAGSTAARLLFGTTAGFGIYYGSGVPTVSAAQGSLYLRSDGDGVAARAYINNSAGSGTTWTAIATAG